MFTAYLDDYYKGALNVDDICGRSGYSQTTFHKWLKRMGYPSRSAYFALIDVGIPELNRVLGVKYSSLVNRCKGKSTDYYGHYCGREYPTVYGWVEFCNSQKERLATMWGTYVVHGRQRRYAISVDRIDDDLGYTLGNMQFVTHGFNSWKRSVYPIAVAHEGQTRYFLTREDASRAYGLRRQSIGEAISGNKYAPRGFAVTESTVEDVLASLLIPSLEAYYARLLQDEGKTWDVRKRWSDNTRRRVA